MQYIKPVQLLIVLFATLLVSINTPCQFIEPIHDSSDYYTKAYHTARGKMFEEPKQMYAQLTDAYLYFKDISDTEKVIDCLILMSEIQKSEGRYNISFDHLWEGLYSAKANNHLAWESVLHRKLADLYFIYRLDTESLFHIKQSLAAAKALVGDGSSQTKEIIGSYTYMAIYHRKIGNYQLALTYIDSCFIEGINKDSVLKLSPFINAERGYILLKSREMNESFTMLHNALSSLKYNPPYRSYLLNYLGEWHIESGNADSALIYFERSLRFIRKTGKNYGELPYVLMNLSELYHSQNKHLKAYQYLHRSKAVADSLIQLQNSANKELFQIKDSYLQSMKDKDEFIVKQQEELEHNRQIQLRLKIILGLIGLLAIAALWTIRARLRLRKTIADKEAQELQAKLNEERIQSKVELKSKELTSSALQIIDKDTAIDELLRVIQENAPGEYPALKARHKKGSKDLWDGFNMRFTEVNTEFYTRLGHKHPELSQTELKHCALIKLGFATKEMSRILNITPHSVHISRSRIRKKMLLDRTESLEKYIAEL